jgi:hypothetical protein
MKTKLTRGAGPPGRVGRSGGQRTGGGVTLFRGSIHRWTLRDEQR